MNSYLMKGTVMKCCKIIYLVLIPNLIIQLNAMQADTETMPICRNLASLQKLSLYTLAKKQILELGNCSNSTYESVFNVLIEQKCNLNELLDIAQKLNMPFQIKETIIFMLQTEAQKVLWNGTKDLVVTTKVKFFETMEASSKK